MDQREQLKKRVVKNREEREREKQWKEYLAARWKTINGAPDRIPMEFWCDKCNADFTARGYKTVNYCRNNPPAIAYYSGMCPKGHLAIRRVTDKHHDPYYHQSAVLRRQRVEMADDFLQPSDPRFAQKYPAQWRKMKEEKEAAEQAHLKANE